MTQLWEMDATDVARGVAAGEFSALEVVDVTLERIGQLDHLLHSYSEVAEVSARDAARSVDARVARGERVGPLAGVPVGVKDVIFTEGVRTSGCCSAYGDFVPEEDDVVVSRMRAADAIVVGKTTTSELAYGPGLTPFTPQAVNPWDLNLSPGNSSSGSASAVAAGLATVALGTDGGGSIRCPASFCGIFGMKPSRGRVPAIRDPRYPGLSSWHSLGHCGPMTRTVADAALMMSVIAGPDARDPFALPGEQLPWIQAATPGTLSGLKILYSEDFGYARVDPQVLEVFRRGLHVLESDLGATLVAAQPGWADPGPIMDALIAADTDLREMRRMQAELDCFRSPSIRALLDRDWSAEDLTSALVARHGICALMAEYMDGYDLVVSPTVSVLPFALTDEGPRDDTGALMEISEWCPFTQVANMTGQPAASVPAGRSANGLPVGIHFMGHMFQDLLVIRAAAAFEAASPPVDRWPAMAHPS